MKSKENIEKPQGLELKEILSKLRIPLPAELIKQRKQGGSIIDYIEWTTALDILDEYVGNYSVDISKMFEIGGYVVIEVGITINGERRANIGSEKLSHTGFGDPFTNAFAQAFKRAAASWGIARGLYQDKDANVIIKDNELQIRDLVSELIHVSALRGYDDEKLSMQLERKFKEPNPYKLTVRQLEQAITGISKLPIVMEANSDS